MRCLTLFDPGGFGIFISGEKRNNLAGQGRQYTKVYVVLPQNPNFKVPPLASNGVKFV